MRAPILLALAALLPAPSVLAESNVTVPPTLESQPMVGSGTVTQGAVFWSHPTDPHYSQLLAGNNQNGLAIYNPDGGLRVQLSGGAVQGVDVQEDVKINGIAQQLIMVANTSRGLVSYIIDPSTLDVRSTGLMDFSTGSVPANSVALFKSPASNVLYAFVGSNAGILGQFEINTELDGGLITPVRTLNLGAAVMGLTVDDSQSKVYVALQSTAIWQYGAEPDAGDTRVMVDDLNGGLVSPLGGLALYTGPGIQGYLLAVTGSDSAVRVYDRNPARNTRLGTFTSMATTTIDTVERPRVIAVTNRPFLPGFNAGVVALQDTTNVGSNENFKLLPWDTIAYSFNPQLGVYTDFVSPDAGLDGGTDGGTDGGDTTDAGQSPVEVKPAPLPTRGIDSPSPTGCSCSSASLPGTMLLVLAGLLLARRRTED